MDSVTCLNDTDNHINNADIMHEEIRNCIPELRPCGLWELWLTWATEEGLALRDKKREEVFSEEDASDFYKIMTNLYPAATI